MLHFSPSCFPSPFLSANHMTRILPFLSYRYCLKACNSRPCSLWERVAVKTVATINGDINPTKVADLQAQPAWIYRREQNASRAGMFLMFVAASVAAFRKNSIPFPHFLTSKTWVRSIAF